MAKEGFFAGNGRDGSNLSRLPFTPDSNGVCVITGLSSVNAGDLNSFGADPPQSRNVKETDRRRRQANSFFNADDLLHSGGGTEQQSWSVRSISPRSGSKHGFQLVTIKGSFPAVSNVNSILICFGDKVQRPIRWNTTMLQCYSVPAEKAGLTVPVTVSFDGGTSFTSDEKITFTFTDSTLSEVVRHGSHVFHWGNASWFDPRSGGRRQKNKNKTRDLEGDGANKAMAKGKRRNESNSCRPAWVETKYPIYSEGQLLLLNTFSRKYLHVSDWETTAELLNAQLGDGVAAAQDIMGRFSTLKQMFGPEPDRRLNFSTSENDVMNVLQRQLDAFQRSGMAIKQVACSDTGVLVLLEDGRLVSLLPRDRNIDHDSFLTLEKEARGVQVERLIGPQGFRSADTLQSPQQTRIARMIKGKLLNGVWLNQTSPQIVMIPPEEFAVQELIDAAFPSVQGSTGWFFQEKTHQASLTGNTSIPPVPVFPRFQQVAQVAAGAHHFCAVTDIMCGSHLYTWGDNSYGQLGLGVGDLAVYQPTKVEFEFGGSLSRAVTTLCCGPNTTIVAARNIFGRTELFSWGVGTDPTMAQLKDIVRRAQKGGGEGAPPVGFPHSGQVDFPQLAFEFKPCEMEDKGASLGKFWTKELEEWLLAVEQDWYYARSTVPYWVEVNDTQERLDSFGKLADVMEKHFQMKHAYIEDLESILDQGTAVYDDVGESGPLEKEDPAVTELHGLINSLDETILFLKSSLHDLGETTRLYHTELRKTDLSIRVFLEEVDTLSREALSFAEKKREPTRFSVDSTGQQRQEEVGQGKGRSESTNSESKTLRGKLSSLARVNLPKRLWKRATTSRKASTEEQVPPAEPYSAPATSRPGRNVPQEELEEEEEEIDTEEGSNDDEPLPRRAGGRANSVEYQQDISAVQNKVSELVTHRRTLQNELNKTSLLADEVTAELQQMESSKVLFMDLLADWQLNEDRERFEDCLFSDDFEIVLELLADIQSCNVIMLAEKSEFEEQSLQRDITQSDDIVSGDANNMRLFSRPGGMVRESILEDQTDSELATSRGLRPLVDQLYSKVSSIQKAVDRFSDSPSTDAATCALLDLTNDICALKQVHLHGLKSVSDETERLLGMSLATEFASQDHSHLPSLARDVATVSSPL